MNPRRRRFAFFLVFDAMVVAGLLAWFFGHHPAPPAAPAVPPAAAPAKPDPAVAALPEAPAGAVECHGTFAGQPFWLRLSAPDPELNGNRRLQLVYSPPAQAEVEGAAIHDSPVLILDGNLRVVRWDNRDGATGVLAGDPGYRVVREIHTPGSDSTQLKTRVLKQPAAWDLRLAPLFAALAWKPGAAWRVPVVDFWGARAGEGLTAALQDTTLVIAGTPAVIQAGADGRVAAVLDGQSRPLLSITAWK